MRQRYDSRWRRLRLVILYRDGYRCHWCKRKANEVDHLVSIEEGGSMYAPHNLVASCKACNSSRGAELLKARESGGFLGSRRQARQIGRAHV